MVNYFDVFEQHLKNVFYSPYSDVRKHNGEHFHIVRRMSCENDNIDKEVLPKWIIAFDDGTQIEAWPEEICEL